MAEARRRPSRAPIVLLLLAICTVFASYVRFHGQLSMDYSMWLKNKDFGPPDDALLSHAAAAGQQARRTLPPLLQPKQQEEIPYTFLHNKTRLFTMARSDRSGAAILEYLKAYAFSLEFGLEFGGICGTTKLTNVHRQMIHALGLEQVMKIESCPTNKTTDVIGEQKDINRGIEGSFAGPNVLEYIRAVSYNQRLERRNNESRSTDAAKKSNDDAFKVGLHIRRGDVSPCGYNQRYLPNSFYLQLLNWTALPSNTIVTIFSESLSFENWTEFEQQPNCRILLDGELTEVWTEMMEQDVFYLSRSAFSIVPAIVSSRAKETTYYLPYATGKDPGPLKEWKLVDAALLRDATSKAIRMKNDCTPEMKARLRKGLKGVAGLGAGRRETFVWPEDS